MVAAVTPGMRTSPTLSRVLAVLYMIGAAACSSAPTSESENDEGALESGRTVASPAPTQSSPTPAQSPKPTGVPEGGSTTIVGKGSLQIDGVACTIESVGLDR